MRSSRSQALPNDVSCAELIAILRSKGIRNERVLKAMQTVRRELFVPKIFVRKAYNDVALPIGYDQTISQPFTVAFMTQVLDVQPGDRVLEIGTGSGYQSAILAALGAQIVSIERQTELYSRTKPLLESLQLPIKCILGDGTLGYPDDAPYNKIIVTAGAPVVPSSLCEQLAVGGRLIVPVGSEDKQRMTVVDRVRKNEFSEHVEDGLFSFVPLLGRDGWSGREGGENQ